VLGVLWVTVNPTMRGTKLVDSSVAQKAVGATA